MSAKVNNTLRFILPMLYDNSIGVDGDFFLNKYFIGAFTSDLEEPEYDDDLILVYENSFNEDFEEFDTKIKKYFNPIVEINDEDETIQYIIDIPKEHLDDYNLIITGLFHKISPILKLKIIKMWELSEEDGLFNVLIGLKEYNDYKFEDDIYNLKLEEDVFEII